ncbi:ferritin-like domain-containing protein [Siculibacillus lacustris]|nr:ferritin-like domain-containing protein [Siculibacillus lacustris]
MAAIDPSADVEIRSREQLLYTLAEAAEIEHNLMCCYLYAAWSLKTEPDDGVDQATGTMLRRWQRAIVAVAIDEMSHLAMVANLMAAIGGAAHFQRPNFPIAAGYHPAGLQVRLAPFSMATLQHFIHLERPEGSDEPDGEGFAPPLAYGRGLNGLEIMPSAQDFTTVGHLYRSIETALGTLAAQLGEAVLFCGDPRLQVGPSLVSLPGLATVTDLASAIRAIEVIVEQGEGHASDREDSHFRRFIRVRSEYAEALARDPAFVAAHPAAENPVMRRPPAAAGRVWIQREDARAVLDLGNAVYNHMLRCLAQGFGDTDPTRKRRALDTAIDAMFALDPLARELARLRANDADACNAGLSFATLRAYPFLAPDTAATTLTERIGELARGATALPDSPRVAAALAALGQIAAKTAAASRVEAMTEATAAPPADPVVAGPPPAAVGGNSGIESVEGRDLVIAFEGRRCIHARFCVTGAPKTFLANVQGPWLHPDDTDTDRLIEVAHACPSGAIGYRRKDGKPDEAPPPVNLLNIREAGPYAIRAPMTLAGREIGHRATLCRCGASKNKPFCDGSHHDIGFAASGEPATVSLDPLPTRDGPLAVTPLADGPLAVAGNLEICAGTGRVVQRVTEARLCRCGQSKTKPFCDGSHRAAGFQADGA